MTLDLAMDSNQKHKQQKEKTDQLDFIKIKNWEYSKTKNTDGTVETID